MKTPFHRRCMEVARSRSAPGKAKTNSGYKHLLEMHNFYKLNVSYVTTYIIKSDYYSVTDKFKFKNTTVRTGN